VDDLPELRPSVSPTRWAAIQGDQLGIFLFELLQFANTGRTRRRLPAAGRARSTDMWRSSSARSFSPAQCGFRCWHYENRRVQRAARRNRLLFPCWHQRLSWARILPTRLIQGLAIVVDDPADKDSARARAIRRSGRRATDTPGHPERRTAAQTPGRKRFMPSAENAGAPNWLRL